MITRVKGLKISQVPELKEITGDEMIPYQYKCTNGKISAATLASYISENLDPNDPSGAIGKLQDDVQDLNERVDDLQNLKIQVDTNTQDIADLNGKIESAGGGDASYVDKKLEEFKATKGQPNGLASLNAEGTIDEDQLPDNIINIDEVQKVTYDELKALADGGNLIPGVKYGITDYSCVYIMPIAEEEIELPADDFELIVCTAETESILNENVTIIRTPGKVRILEAKYTIDSERYLWTKGMTVKHPKGTIYWLKDGYQNATCYDFKHIKFRRWAIRDVAPNMTEDTGSNNNVSPFRVNVSAMSRKPADTRMFIGSSDPIEKTLIPALFAGNWRCGGETTPRFPDLEDIPALGSGVNMYPYTDEFITRFYKPYQDVNYENDKYLAWDVQFGSGLSGCLSDRAMRGFGASYSHFGPIANFDIDPDDYLDRYTFDYEGTDGSEMYHRNGKRPIFFNNVIDNNGYLGYNLKLPNTVIALSKSCYNENIDDDIADNVMIGRNLFYKNTSKNTILLNKVNPTSAYPWMQDNIFGERFQVGGNLMLISDVLQRCNIKRMEGSFIIGGFNNVDIENLMYYCYIVGYYNSCKFKELNNDVLFGCPIRYQTTDAPDTLKTCYDGEYWYNVYGKDFNDANILGPFQYSYFGPHMNNLLARSVYNKSVRFEGSNQLMSFGSTRWGVRFDYGAMSTSIFKSIVHCTFKDYSISNHEYEADHTLNGNSTGIGGFSEELVAKAIPHINSVDFMSSGFDPWYKIKEDLGEVSYASYAPSKNRRIGWVNNGKFTISTLDQIFNPTTTLNLDEEANQMSAEQLRAMYEVDLEIPKFPTSPFEKEYE